MELGPEDVYKYIQASRMELGPEDVSLLEGCAHFRVLCIYRLQWSWNLPIEKVFQHDYICDHICINQHSFAPYGWFIQIWSHIDKEETKMSCASVQTIYVCDHICINQHFIIQFCTIWLVHANMVGSFTYRQGRNQDVMC